MLKTMVEEIITSKSKLEEVNRIREGLEVVLGEGNEGAQSGM